MSWSGKFKNGKSFNNLSDSEIEQFASKIDENTVKENALPEATSPDTVQGGVIFMHPTTPEKAKAYAEGMGTISQEEADARNANTGDAYTLARNVLTTGLAPYTAGLEYLKDRAFNEGSWASGIEGDPYSQYILNHLEAGNKGEGAVGFLGNPTNVIASQIPLTLGGTLAMGGLGATEAAYQELDAARRAGEPVDALQVGKHALTTGGIAAGLHGGLSALRAGSQAGGEFIAKPYIEIQAQAEKNMAENARKAKALAEIERDAPFNAEMTQYIKGEDYAGLPEYERAIKKAQIENKLAENAHKRMVERTSNPLEERLRRDRPELFQGEKETGAYSAQAEREKQAEYRQVLDDVKMMMKRDAKNFPEYQYGKVNLYGYGDRLVEPTDADAARYLLDLKKRAPVDISNKGYETLQGFPMAQRLFGGVAGAIDRLPANVKDLALIRKTGGIASELGGKGYTIPNLLNNPKLYNAPAPLISPLELRGSVYGFDKAREFANNELDSAGQSARQSLTNGLYNFLQ